MWNRWFVDDSESIELLFNSQQFPQIRIVRLCGAEAVSHSGCGQIFVSTLNYIYILQQKVLSR